MRLPEDPHAVPDTGNDFLAAHATLLCTSYQRLLHKPLISNHHTDVSLASALYHAPFIVLSHDAQQDPCFTYANLAAQRLFAMPWHEIIGLPSKHSAEPVNRQERSRLLDAVSRQGFIDDYSGVRIAKNGQRFLIKRATVWNLYDDNAVYQGQAATFSDWQPLSH